MTYAGKVDALYSRDMYISGQVRYETTPDVRIVSVRLSWGLSHGLSCLFLCLLDILFRFSLSLSLADFPV